MLAVSFEVLEFQLCVCPSFFSMFQNLLCIIFLTTNRSDYSNNLVECECVLSR